MMRLKATLLLSLFCVLSGLNLVFANPIAHPQQENLNDVNDLSDGHHETDHAMQHVDSTISIPAVSESHHVDPHAHGSHTKPLESFNETQILQKHGVDPLAYWRYDLQSPSDYPSWLKNLDISENAPRHPQIIVAHVILMTLDFLIVLPIGLALRTVHHPLYAPVLFLFLSVFVIAILLSSAYSALTPNLYENNVHAKIGWITVLFIAGLFTLEFLSYFKRFITWFKGERTFKSFISTVLSKPQSPALEYESIPLNEDNDHHHISPTESTSSWAQGFHDSDNHVFQPSPLRNSSYPLNEIENERRDTAESVRSNRSEETLHDYPPHQRPLHVVRSPDELDDHRKSYMKPNHHYQDNRKPLSRSEKFGVAAKYGQIFALRSLLLFYFIQLQSGIAVYSGSCRGSYLNGCMAHMIKGGIFFAYGLLTWIRFLGGWAEFGFAWNKKPYSSGWRSKVPTFEFLESFVIFLYGCTNTWMERFGAKAGDPYTVKQVQHISIAVMFFGAGAVGLLIEWKAARSWLMDNIISHANIAGHHVVQVKNPSITFNPFPALCIGITGLAMSFHHQNYVFQVNVHQLWGFLLTGFSLMRFLTYFFLHLRPPASVLPSRPPTEALASFFLTAGGMSFVLSTEQITFAAMRYGYDDVMAFLNFTASVVAMLFALSTVVMAIKGWASQRMSRANIRARRQSSQSTSYS